MAFRLQTSRPGTDGPQAARRKETLDLYGCDPGQAVVRAGLPARAADGRARRALRQHLSRRLGRPQRRGRQPYATTARRPTRRAPPWCADLKQRGLLDDTLVIWGGEFGRTPMVETTPRSAARMGRDHHPQAFTMWMAGGGIKPGLTYGATDDLGFHVVENPVHVHDLQATILHLPRLRPREAHLPLRRPRLPPDRRAWQRREGHIGLSRALDVRTSLPFSPKISLEQLSLFCGNMATCVAAGLDIPRSLSTCQRSCA